MIYIAVAVDLTTDGLMIGSASALSLGLALTLAAGQVPADVPEGYAAMANFRKKGLTMRRRILLSLSFFPFVIATSLLAFWLLSDAAGATKSIALIIVAGLLTEAAVDDMLEEAHAFREDSSWSVLVHLSRALRSSRCYPKGWERWSARNRPPRDDCEIPQFQHFGSRQSLSG